MTNSGAAATTNARAALPCGHSFQLERLSKNIETPARPKQGAKSAYADDSKYESFRFEHEPTVRVVDTNPFVRAMRNLTNEARLPKAEAGGARRETMQQSTLLASRNEAWSLEFL